MSLLPYLLERRRAFELGYDDDLLHAVTSSLMSGDVPWRTVSQGLTHTSKNKFQINLDVLHFSPDEISVRTDGGFVIVEGRHDEKRDEHGWVARHFTRRYALPEGCTEDSVQSRLSSDGVLTVTAMLDAPQANERVVPIVCTGPVRQQGSDVKL
ncbi:protein lethal(2)essential for life-like [Hyposmocoma kahamanoa]|uniref:protein lethal(2)essential for life-like n=1 Tax=Hyposmocoma kahamanoa TaxID=1477025 RepID=UPI000E6D73E1|nr:protein lethal(2)essential for life-like [Hyposmocoma kahamanoa]